VGFVASAPNIVATAARAAPVMLLHLSQNKMMHSTNFGFRQS
jgi:hypothetical protein